MLFCEKLSFLLRITGASNKQLASAISVDPSLISRMKKGQRVPPKNGAHVTGMAGYFARKVSTDYQRMALAETLGQNRLKLIMKTDSLSAILEEWLAGDGTPISSVRKIEHIIHEFALDQPEETVNTFASVPEHPSEVAYSRAYYGNAGRRSALRAFLSYVLRLDQPCTILVTTDESLEWLYESPSFSYELTALIQKLVNAGHSFRRITPWLNNIDEAMASFDRWIPIFMQGKLELYYYPRLRDDVFHRTIFAVPGVIALSSTSVGFHLDIDITYLNYDAGMANAAAREFNDYLAKCVRVGERHTHGDGGERVCDCLQRFLEMSADKTALYLALPSPVTPPCVLRRILAGRDEYIRIYENFARQYDLDLARSRRTDIITLADPQDVRDGKVLCIATTVFPDVEPCYYTTFEYIEHLRTLIRLMEKYPDYCVVIPEDAAPFSTIWVSRGGVCLIIRTKPPFTVFETSEQHMVSKAAQYIQHIAGATLGTKTIQRNRTLEKLRALIQTLETES